MHNLPFVRFSRTYVLSLYRKILKMHKLYLPPQFREFGDKYVKEEWRRHKETKGSQRKVFLQHWGEYADHFVSGGGESGRDLRTQEVDSLSEDQQTQLQLLKVEAKRKGQTVAEELLGPSDVAMSAGDSK